MTVKKKLILIVLFASIMLGSTLFLPGTARADDNSTEIFENINLDKKPINFVEMLDYFETVTANPAAFLNDVSDGHVTLRLLGQKFQLELQEVHIVSDDAVIITENGSRIPAPKAYSYKGTVAGKPDSSAALTVGDDVIIGEINIENKSYFIEQTNITHNGKVVHVVYTSDAFKKREILEYNTDGPAGQDLSDLPTVDSGHNNYVPGFGLLGCLVCLYGGWKLKKR